MNLDLSHTLRRASMIPSIFADGMTLTHGQPLATADCRYHVIDEAKLAVVHSNEFSWQRFDGARIGTRATDRLPCCTAIFTVLQCYEVTNFFHLQQAKVSNGNAAAEPLSACCEELRGFCCS